MLSLSSVSGTEQASNSHSFQRGVEEIRPSVTQRNEATYLNEMGFISFLSGAASRKELA